MEAIVSMTKYTVATIELHAAPATDNVVIHTIEAYGPLHAVLALLARPNARIQEPAAILIFQEEANRCLLQDVLAKLATNGR